jgi:hypothetical protein
LFVAFLIRIIKQTPYRDWFAQPCLLSRGRARIVAATGIVWLFCLRQPQVQTSGDAQLCRVCNKLTVACSAALSI